MNSLPIDFYERITHYIPRDVASVLSDLEPPMGAISAKMMDKLVFHSVGINQDHFYDNSYLSTFKKPITRFKTVFSRYILYTKVNVRGYPMLKFGMDGVEQRLLEATRGKNVLVFLTMRKPTDKIMKYLDLIRFVSVISFHTSEMEDCVAKFLVKVVQKRTLHRIHFTADHKLDQPTKQCLLDLLKQEQFYTTDLPRNCRSYAKDVLAEWSRNSEEMVGKQVWWLDHLGDVESEEFGFRKCTLDEENYVHKYYPQALGLWGKHSSAFLLIGQAGRAIYSFVNEQRPFKSMFLIV